MAELKTKPTAVSPAEFLDSIADEQIREDCRAIADMMRAATKAEPVMWGPAIVGFGTYHYVNASGREGDWMIVGLSPRKKNITLYLMYGLEQNEELLAKLGKHDCGKGCLYIKRLADVHVPTLKKLIQASVKHTLKTAAEANAKKAKAGK